MVLFSEIEFKSCFIFDHVWLKEYVMVLEEEKMQILKIWTEIFQKDWSFPEEFLIKKKCQRDDKMKH